MKKLIKASLSSHSINEYESLEAYLEDTYPPKDYDKFLRVSSTRIWEKCEQLFESRNTNKIKSLIDKVLNDNKISSSTDILGASSGSDAYEELVSNLKADFDYVIDGLDKMVRDGNGSEALALAGEFNATIDGMANQVAGSVTE